MIDAPFSPPNGVFAGLFAAPLKSTASAFRDKGTREEDEEEGMAMGIDKLIKNPEYYQNEDDDTSVDSSMSMDTNTLNTCEPLPEEPSQPDDDLLDVRQPDVEPSPLWNECLPEEVATDTPREGALAPCSACNHIAEVDAMCEQQDNLPSSTSSGGSSPWSHATADIEVSLGQLQRHMFLPEEPPPRPPASPLLQGLEWERPERRRWVVQAGPEPEPTPQMTAKIPCEESSDSDDEDGAKEAESSIPDGETALEYSHIDSDVEARSCRNKGGMQDRSLSPVTRLPASASKKSGSKASHSEDCLDVTFSDPLLASRLPLRLSTSTGGEEVTLQDQSMKRSPRSRSVSPMHLPCRRVNTCGGGKLAVLQAPEPEPESLLTVELTSPRRPTCSDKKAWGIDHVGDGKADSSPLTVSPVAVSRTLQCLIDANNTTKSISVRSEASKALAETKQCLPTNAAQPLQRQQQQHHHQQQPWTRKTAVACSAGPEVEPSPMPKDILPVGSALDEETSEGLPLQTCLEEGEDQDDLLVALYESALGHLDAVSRAVDAAHRISASRCSGLGVSQAAQQRHAEVQDLLSRLTLKEHERLETCTGHQAWQQEAGDEALPHFGISSPLRTSAKAARGGMRDTLAACISRKVGC
mmetsp:Transcript_66924/g.169001  ORF Transcript_66924/g.169001 Transcript_66924/m.169001 type:complete len:639 (-) Transcript_66924:210-2126(-)